MEVNYEQLKERYQAMSDEDLEHLVYGGGLTDQAKSIIEVELRSRGFEARDAIQAQIQTPPEPTLNEKIFDFVFSPITLVLLSITVLDFLRRQYSG